MTKPLNGDSIMTTNSTNAQTNISQLADTLTKNPMLNELISSSDVKSYLVNGMSNLISKACDIERNMYLQDNTEDAGNGYLPERNIMLGTTAVPISTPRTRSGGFYPTFLPKYQRVLPQDYEHMLRDILLNSSNFANVKRMLGALNLPYQPQQLDTIINEIHQQAKHYFQRRLDPDWYFLYIDAKNIDLADENKKINKAVIFTVVGIDTNCKRHILSIQLFWGNESLDLWKKVFIDLKNRGLTRPLTLITDGFSGITGLTQSLFPDSFHQLCIVHLKRNAFKHLCKDQYQAFMIAIDELSLSPNQAVANPIFTAACDAFKNDHAHYAKHLLARVDFYTNFTHFPRDLRPHIHATNPVEGFNNATEIIQRNAGGHFHSEREVLVKLKIKADQLIAKKWRSPIPKIKHHIHDISNLFIQTFEASFQDDSFFNTQHS
jgi:putative transposase